MKKITKISVISLLLLAILTSEALAIPLVTSYLIRTDVISSGGQTTHSANYSLISTVGQPMIGLNQAGSASACSGFLCTEPLYRSFLAMIKNLSP